MKRRNLVVENDADACTHLDSIMENIRATERAIETLRAFTANSPAAAAALEVVTTAATDARHAADPNRPPHDASTKQIPPVQAAALLNRPAAIREVFAACTARGDQIPRGVENALYAAAHMGYPDCVDALLGNGADVNAEAPGYYATPLDGAVEAGDAPMVHRLLAAGAHPDDDGQHAGQSGPLVQAVIFGHSEIVRHLLKFGARPNKLRRTDAKSPAMVAISTGPAGSVRGTLCALFDYGAVVAPAGAHTTVLNEAIVQHNDTAVEWLVAHVDTGATAAFVHPLYAAITAWTTDPRCAAIVRTLLQNKTYIQHERNDEDMDRETRFTSDLCVAAASQKAPTADHPLLLLLQHGVMRHPAVQATLSVNCEAMNIAAMRGNIGNMRLLRLYGAPAPRVHRNSLNRRTRAITERFIDECTRYTPISMAIKFGHQCAVPDAIRQGCATPSVGGPLGFDPAWVNGLANPAELAPLFKAWSRTTHATHHAPMRSAARAFMLAMHRGGQSTGAALHIPVELQLIVLQYAMVRSAWRPISFERQSGHGVY